MKKTTIYLPEDLAMSVSAAAMQHNRSEASLIREAVATYVASLERPWPKSIAIVSDGTVQGKDSEDWIQENWHPE